MTSPLNPHGPVGDAVEDDDPGHLLNDRRGGPHRVSRRAFGIHIPALEADKVGFPGRVRDATR